MKIYLSLIAGIVFFFYLIPKAGAQSIITGTVTGTITACEGTASASPNIQQFTVSGSNLTNDVIVSAPAGFEISLSPNSGYGITLTLTPNSGSINPIIYVRASAANFAGPLKSGNVKITTAGLQDVYVTVKGTINLVPTVNSISSKTYVSGSTTLPIPLTGKGNNFTWTNSNPGIGLVASGTGDIGSFTAVNNTTSPITATITATSTSSGFAYISNYYSNSVSVINTLTNTIVGSPIGVGIEPRDVSVSADGSRIYVVSRTSSRTLSIINAATNTVLSSPLVGITLSGVVVSPDGSKVYCGDISSGITIVNTNTYVPYANIPMNKYYGELAISPDGNWLYATSAPNNIMVINTNSNTITTTIPVGQAPEGMVFSPDGSLLYVTNFASNTLSVVNTITNTVIATIPINIAPAGIAISPDGSRLYITGITSNTVQIINTATNTFLTPITVDPQPTGISISPDGSRLYVVSQMTNNLLIINTATNTIVSSILLPSPTLSFGNFVTGGSSCSSVPATFTITVVPKPVITTNNTLSALATVYGMPSASTSFSISATNLTAGILVSAPPGFEISSDNITFSPASVTIGAAGNITSVPVYIRLAQTTPVGIYAGDITLSTAGTANTSLTMASSSVTRASLTITANNVTKPYGTTLTAVTGSTNFTATGLQNGETIGSVILTYGIGASAGSAVGTYTGSVNASSPLGGSFLLSNYTITPIAADIIITTAPLTVTADDKSKFYGAVNPTLTITYTGFVNNDKAAQLTTQPTITTTAVITSPVGTYPITVSGAASPNYSFTYVTGTLTVKPAVDLMLIPNAFTPNGDAVNDVWDIAFLQNYPNCTVEIYNRSGEKVFRSSGYTKPWDGTNNGKPLPVGTYYYIIVVDNYKSQTFAGSVAIIR